MSTENDIHGIPVVSGGIGFLPAMEMSIERRIAQFIVGATICTATWSSVRFFGFSIFDFLSIFCIFSILIVCRKVRVDLRVLLRFFVLFLAILFLSCAVSSVMASDVAQHIYRSIAILTSFFAMIFLSYLIVSRAIFSEIWALYFMVVSTLTSGVVSILQGQFSLFTNFMEVEEAEIFEWTRPTGLAGHPIEAGVTAGYGIVILIGTIRFANSMSNIRFVIQSGLIFVSIISMMYSASFTAIGSTIFAILGVILLNRRWILFSPILLLPTIGALDFFIDTTNLRNRLLDLFTDGASYETIASRTEQINETISKIDFATFLTGHGYSDADLPAGLDVHNTLLASDFHFGILGLFAQFLIWSIFAFVFFKSNSRDSRAVLFGVLVIFLSCYLTGPTLSRRSVWFLPILATFYCNGISRRASPQQVGNDVGSSILTAGGR